MHNSFQNAIQPKENKKILSSPLWLLFPHSMKRLQCSSHQQAQRKQQCIFSSTRNQNLPLLQFWSWHFHWPWEYCCITVYDWEKVSLNAQFRVFLFYIQKTEHQSKFSSQTSHPLYRSHPSGNLKPTTTLYEFSSLYFGIKTLQRTVVNVWYIKLTWSYRWNHSPLLVRLPCLSTKSGSLSFQMYTKILLQKASSFTKIS